MTTQQTVPEPTCGHTHCSKHSTWITSPIRTATFMIQAQLLHPLTDEGAEAKR